MIVKIPVTRAGIPAIEEATYRGISINATVCFTLPQCVAVAEAVERGLKRREREGKEIATMGPVCTIMVGRLDDWLKVLAEKNNIAIDPGYLEWAGVAVFKKTYQLFPRTRLSAFGLLSAAFRNHMHWSEFIGGDVVISPPYSWQLRFNASDIEVRPRIDEPVADSNRRDSVPENSPISAAPTTKMASHSPSLIRLDRPDELCGNSLRPVTTSMASSATFCFPILI